MGNRHIRPAGEDYSGDEEQRPCARGKWCRSRNEKGEPTLGPRVLCSADRDSLRRTIEALPELYLELWTRLGTKSSSDGPRVSGGGKTPPTPINLSIDAFMSRMVEVLESWEERVRIVARLNLDGIGQARRDSVAMYAMCRTLTAHLDVLLALGPEPMNRSVDDTRLAALPDDAEGHVRPAGWAILRQDLDGGDAAVEIWALERSARGKLGYTPRHQDLLSPCWNLDCEQRMLRRWDGAAGMDDHVVCRACGEKYEGDQLARLMADEQRLKEHRARKEAS